MRRRSKMSRRRSKRLFRRTAGTYHKRNRIRGMSRGGTRL